MLKRSSLVFGNLREIVRGEKGKFRGNGSLAHVGRKNQGGKARGQPVLVVISSTEIALLHRNRRRPRRGPISSRGNAELKSAYEGETWWRRESKSTTMKLMR